MNDDAFDFEKLSFTLDGWEEYTAWQSEDKRTLKKINRQEPLDL